MGQKSEYHKSHDSHIKKEFSIFEHQTLILNILYQKYKDAQKKSNKNFHD